MEKESFSPMAVDALGEIMNISLGSSATAISNMLDHRVDITTPAVTVVDVQDFTLDNMEPAIGVEIKYVEGLSGSNIMLLKRSDIKVIVDILMGMETSEEDFELNELTISCVCEVMNQMMGSAATAMSDFLGFRVDISTPTSFELNDLEEFKQEHLPEGADQVVMVRFFLKIEGALESKFINVMSVELAKELLKGQGLGNEVGVGMADSAPASAAAPAQAAAPAPEPEPEMPRDSNRVLSQEEIEKLIAGNIAADPEPSNQMSNQGGAEKMAPEPTSAGSGAQTANPAQPAPSPQQGAPAAQMGQPGQMPYPYPPMPGADGQMQGGYMGYPPMYYPPYPYPYPATPDPKVIATKPVVMEQLDPAERLGKEQAQNLDLIMEVPLQVTVEIGRARRKVQDILEFAKGSLVVLDKLAGDQVDVFVNGKCIAHGDVVVIDDNFGIRISEIIKRPGLEELTR